jgi:beta-glucosidase
MPTYLILELAGHPPVAAGFDKVLLTDILKDREGFSGLVLSDWSITEDCRGPCLGEPFTGDRSGLMGKPWGVEHLTRAERFVLAIEAGNDQIGYDPQGRPDDSSPIVDAVRSGKLPMARIDDAVRRIMTIKFRTGLFENPFVDPARATQIVGNPEAHQAALAAQQRSLVLLENKKHLLPLLPDGKRVFLRGIAAEAARQAGFTVVDRIDQADLAIIRTVTPWQLVHANYPFGRLQHEGDMDFKPDNEDLQAIEQAAAAKVQTIVTVYLERPAILTNVRPLVSALIGNFGVSDAALLGMITGRTRPSGKLPFDLPSSMAAAHDQNPDVPGDTRKPLYRRGFGRTY